MLDENLLITASKAARGITAAQAAVDEAKRLVEEAKAGVETAKNGLSEAKATYDAIIAEIAGAGLSASKARKAVEDMLRIFAEVGIIDAPGEEAAPAEPKAPRRKKAEVATVTVETAVTEYPAPEIEADAAVTEVAAEPEVQETATVVEEAVIKPEAPAAAETAVVAEAAAEAEVAEIDNGEAIGEIYAIIEASTENEDISVSETLITLLNAADWYSREHRKEALTLDLYREILNVDFINQAAASEGLDKETKVAFETVCQSDKAESIFEWFLYVLEKLENGSNHVSYAEHIAQNAATVPEVAEEVSEQVAEIEAAAIVEEVEDEIETSDFTPDPENADDLTDDVSDDVTLAADEGLVGVEVDDIEEINFLDPSSEPAEAPVAPATETSEVAPAPAADNAAPRGFKRPSFLSKKG
jgi:hypothetical protein